MATQIGRQDKGEGKYPCSVNDSHTESSFWVKWADRGGIVHVGVRSRAGSEKILIQN